MKIKSLILMVSLTVSISASDFNITSELTKYSELKNELYVKRISKKRDLMAKRRTNQEQMREYRALKLYASLRK